MKTKLAKFVLTVALASGSLASAQAQQVPQPKSAADVVGTPPGTVMTSYAIGGVAAFWLIERTLSFRMNPLTK